MGFGGKVLAEAVVRLRADGSGLSASIASETAAAAAGAGRTAGSRFSKAFEDNARRGGTSAGRGAAKAAETAAGDGRGLFSKFSTGATAEGTRAGGLFSRGVQGAARTGGQQAGKEFGNALAGSYRDANGRLRNANGRFISDAEQTGAQAGRRFSFGFRRTASAGLAGAGSGGGVGLLGLMGGGALLGAAAGAGALLFAGVKEGLSSAASSQQAIIGYDSLLPGGADVAQKFYGQLQQFAASTPFELPGLVDNARQLLGVGQSSQQVFGDLTALGNASSALGLDQERFNRVMLATSQAMATGKLQAGDLMQITEAGIPVWPLLSKALGKPIPELQKLSSQGKLMSADVFPKLFDQMNKDYSGAMVKQSQTLNGVWSTVKDTIGLALGTALQPLVPILVDILPGAAQGVAGAIGFMGDAFGKIAPAIKPIAGAVKAVFDLVVGGDFTGAFARAFNIEEDAPIVGQILGIRDRVIETVQGIPDALAGIGGRIRDNIGALFDGFAQGSGGANPFEILISSAETVGPAVLGTIGRVFDSLLSFGQSAATTLGPVLGQIGAVVRDDIAPAIAQIVTGFGGIVTAGLALGSALLPTIADIASKVVDVLGPGISGIADLFTNQLVPAFQAFLPAVQPVLEFLLRVFGDAVVGAIRGVVNVVQGVIQVISGILTVFTGLLTGNWSQAWNGLKQIVSGAFQAIVGLIQVWWNVGILRLFRVGVGAIKLLWSGGWNALKGVVMGAKGAIEGVVKGLWSGVKTAFSSGGTAIKTAAKGAWTGVKSAFSTGGSAVKSVAGTAWSGIKTVFSTGGSAIKRLSSSAWTGIKSGFETGAGAIKHATDSAMEFLKRIWATAMSFLTTRTGSKLDEVIAFFTGLPGRILSALGDLSGLLVNAGENLMGGLAKGIGKGVGKVTDAVKGAANLVRGAWPFSPAKWGPLRTHPMDKAGSNIMRMLAEGLGKDAPVRKAIGLTAVEVSRATAGISGHGGSQAPGFKARPVQPYPVRAGMNRSEARMLAVELAQALGQVIPTHVRLSTGELVGALSNDVGRGAYL